MVQELSPPKHACHVEENGYKDKVNEEKDATYFKHSPLVSRNTCQGWICFDVCVSHLQIILDAADRSLAEDALLANVAPLFSQWILDEVKVRIVVGFAVLNLLRRRKPRRHAIGYCKVKPSLARRSEI